MSDKLSDMLDALYLSRGADTSDKKIRAQKEYIKSWGKSSIPWDNSEEVPKEDKLSEFLENLYREAGASTEEEKIKAYKEYVKKNGLKDIPWDKE